jgi:hypothetical protein
VYCPNCGKELDFDDEYCPNCFVAVGSHAAAEEQAEAVKPSVPAGAVLLSLIIPGMGGVLTGRPVAGVLILVMSVAALIVALSSAVMVPLCLSVMLVLWIGGIWIVTSPEESSFKPQSL